MAACQNDVALLKGLPSKIAEIRQPAAACACVLDGTGGFAFPHEVTWVGFWRLL